MRNSYLVLLITLFVGAVLSAQVKIGDNPQNIDPSSVLELESTDKVLVITRVTTAQMNAIVPSEGALCFNTDLQSVHYYNGTQWVNVGGGGGTGGPLTADAIVNAQPTIVITPTATGDNLEVAPNSIRSEQIVDGGVNGVDIQDGSIGPGKLQDFSITQEKLSENSVGAFALDNDSFGVSAFNNDAGYITAGDIDIVSPDANNALEDRPNGVFYNDQFLIDAVNQNTDAIALDNDQSATNEIQSLSIVGNEITISGSNTITLPAGSVADGSETIVTAGTNVTVTGNGTTATPYVINSTGGGADDQTAEEVPYDPSTSGLTATNTQAAIDEIVTSGLINEQSIALETTMNEIQLLNSDNTTVGSIVKLDGTTIEAVNNGTDNVIRLADGAVTPAKIQPSATNSQFLSTDATGAVAWANLPPSGGAVLFDAATISGTGVTGDEYTVADDGITTVKVLNANITPLKIEPSATNGQFLSTDATGAVAWANLPPSGGAALFDATTISGTGVTGDEYTVADDGITTTKIENATILAEDLNAMGATADGDIIKWNTDINGDGSGGGWEVGVNSGHTGPTNSIFFADDDTGAPTTATNPDDVESLVWDQANRLGYGQLQIGLDGRTAPTNVSKVVIAETISPGADVMYPLLIQTSAPASDNASTGILFSPEEHGPATLSKGALIYQRTGGWARGDFHFLQSDTDGTILPVTNDKAFTVKNNKDIVLYNGIDINGIGKGTAGQVLASTGNTTTDGVEWVDNGGLPTGTSNNQVIKWNNTTLAWELGTDDGDIPDGTTDDQVIKWNNTTSAWELGTDDGDIPIGTADDQVIKWNNTTLAWELGVDNGDIPDGTADDQVIKWNNTTLAWELGADGDTDDTNEIQAISSPNSTILVTPTGDDDFNIVIASVQGSSGGTSVIVPASIDQADIADGAIVGGAGGVIADNSITASDIQNDAVDSGEIRIDAVGLSEIQTGAVASDEIVDESIADIDIATAAGIAGTKINPNFGGQDILTTGNVGGNIITAQGNLVTVTGSIFKGAVDVHPDYVFQKYFLGNSTIKESYSFESLEEIETFVKKNYHLPGIKSASTVKAEGVWDIGISNLQNLEKIEELFLHTIEQEKKIKSLKSENQVLKEELKSLQNSVDEIKTLLKTKQ